MNLTPRRFNILKNIKISDSNAKFILLLLFYNCTCSLNELNEFSEIPIKKIIKALDLLVENNLVLRREGSIPSYTGDEHDTVYQYQINII